MSQDISTQHTMGEGDRPAGTEDLLPPDRDDRDADERSRVDDDRLAAEGQEVQEVQNDQDRLEQERLADERQFDGQDLRSEQDQFAESRDSGQDWRAGQDQVPSQERMNGELGDMGPSQFEPPPQSVEQVEPVEQAAPAAGPGDREATQLFAVNEVEGLRTRWLQVQAAFVDDPRNAVQQADQLVAEVMQTLAAMFNKNKQELEGQWRREGTADTEDLRHAVLRYRAFFHQLLRT
jgi:hypothetical protein